MEKQAFARIAGLDENFSHWDIVAFILTHHPKFSKGYMFDIFLANVIKGDGYKYVDSHALAPLIPDAIIAARASGVIVDEQEGIYERFNVIGGFCVNFRRKTVKEVLGELVKHLPSELMDQMDYFGIASAYEVQGKPLFPEFHWIGVYYVTGGSEGYYLHVDAIGDQGDRNCVFVGKTLLEGKAGRELMSKVVAEVSRWLEV